MDNFVAYQTTSLLFQSFREESCLLKEESRLLKEGNPLLKEVRDFLREKVDMLQKAGQSKITQGIFSVPIGFALNN